VSGPSRVSTPQLSQRYWALLRTMAMVVAGDVLGLVGATTIRGRGTRTNRGSAVGELDRASIATLVRLS
jgi:hypothetical protein